MCKEYFCEKSVIMNELSARSIINFCQMSTNKIIISTESIELEKPWPYK